MSYPTQSNDPAATAQPTDPTQQPPAAATPPADPAPYDQEQDAVTTASSAKVGDVVTLGADVRDPVTDAQVTGRALVIDTTDDGLVVVVPLHTLGALAVAADQVS